MQEKTDKQFYNQPVIKDPKRERESYKQKIIARMNWLIKDHHIAEDEWITDEMYYDNSEEGKEKLARYKFNKLTLNWFNDALINCQIAVEKFIDDLKLKNNLQQKCEELRKEVRSTAEKQGKTNRKLIKKAEDLMNEIKSYL